MLRATLSVRGMGVVAALAAVGTLCVACPSLEDIPLGECGNGVVEEDLGEECDAAPEAAEKSSKREHCARANEENACHFVWDASTCCPAGTGEGVDGRCRTPSGQVEDEPILRIAEPALGTGAYDVDGDGYKDLSIRYLSREIELRFLGPDVDRTPRRDVRPSSQYSQASFGTLEAPPAATFDDCGRASAFAPGAIFVPTEQGVRVLVGQEGGGLLPKAFANFDTAVPSLPLALPGLSCEVELDDIEPFVPRELVCTGALAALPSQLGGLTLLSIDVASGKQPVPRYSFGDLDLDAIGNLRPQGLRLPQWQGCDGVLIRFGKPGSEVESSVSILGMCGPGGEAALLGSFEVPERSNVFVLDVDHDAADDLVVATEDELAIHLGDGAGEFDLAYSMDNPRSDDAELPIAIGYLDDDDAFDVVSGHQVWTTHGRCTDPEVACEFQVAGSVPDNPMQEAALADVNGDGQLDVVGRSQDDQAAQPLLVVLASGPQGIYSFDERPAPGVPRYFDVADFDGNGVEDVVFVLSATDGCVTPDEVQIIYSEEGAPAEGVTVAEIPGVTGLAAGTLIGNGDYDGIGDMGFTTSCTDPSTGEPRNRASVVYGNQERSIDAPYPLDQAGEAQEELLFATARIDAAGNPAVVALGHDFLAAEQGSGLTPLLLWMLPVTGAAELPPDNVQGEGGPGVPTGLADAALAGATALLTADLDCPVGGGAGCGIDEVVVFQSTGASAASSSIDEPRLSIFVSPGPPVATTGSCGLSGSGEAFVELSGNPAAGGRTSAVAVDLDGDGLDEIAAWWFYFDPALGLTGGAYVFWNGPAGFAGTCPEVIAPPEGQVITSIAPFRFGEQAGDSLIIGTFGAAFRATFEERSDLDACATTTKPGVCEKILEVPAMHDVSVIDYDLDGLDDLVAATDRDIQIYRQRPQDEVSLEEAAGEAPVEEDD